MSNLRDTTKRDNRFSAAQRLIWLKKVAADNGKLPSAAMPVAIWLTDFFNHSTGLAWPSHDRLAKALALSRSSIERAIRALRARGHLQVAPSRGKTNTYAMTPVKNDGGTHVNSDGNPRQFCRKPPSELTSESLEEPIEEPINDSRLLFAYWRQ